MSNLILNTDSYKFSHKPQYPEDTINLFSYAEMRWSALERGRSGMVLGFQAFVKKYLLDPVTWGDIDEAESIINQHGFPFNREDWEYIIREYNGYLPITIRGVPEGTEVPLKNAICTITVNDSKLFWLVSHIETALLRALWYPSTVATISLAVRRIINRFLVATSDNPSEELNFKLHDFGRFGRAAADGRRYPVVCQWLASGW